MSYQTVTHFYQLIGEAGNYKQTLMRLFLSSSAIWNPRWITFNISCKRNKKKKEILALPDSLREAFDTGQFKTTPILQQLEALCEWNHDLAKLSDQYNKSCHAHWECTPWEYYIPSIGYFCSCHKTAERKLPSVSPLSSFRNFSSFCFYTDKKERRKCDLPSYSWG